MRKFALAIITAAALGLAGSNVAQARYYGHGGHGWVGPAIAGGLILGAIAASRPYYGYPYGYYGGYAPYYGYPAYGYQPYGYPAYSYGYGGCYLTRQVVGYTRRGVPIVRRVRICN